MTDLPITRVLARVTTAILATAFLSGTAQAAGYTLTKLGDLTGGIEESRAYGINDAGQVVGYSYAATGRRAFLWDADGGMQDLGALPGTIDFSTASGINDAGQVAGQSHPATNYNAVLWDAVGNMQDLGALGVGPGSFSSGSSGINNAGQVVGSSIGASDSIRAFLWDADGGMQDLGDLTGKGGRSYANSINELGQVVGYGEVATGQHAFLWDADGGMQDLGNLTGLAGDWSEATDINDLGQIVGWGDIGGSGHAILWDADGTMHDLGALPGAGDWSEASGINNAGQVVGSYSNYDLGVDMAFVWDAINGIQNLNDLIDPGLVGVTLTRATAINESGQIIGFDMIDGYRQAFLLTPNAVVAAVPVPAALPLMLGGLGLLAGVARKRRAA